MSGEKKTSPGATAVSVIVTTPARERLLALCSEFEALGLKNPTPLPHTGVVSGIMDVEKLAGLRQHPAVQTVLRDGPVTGY